jgi:hypothetical protein
MTSRWTTIVPALLAASLLAGCGNIFGGGNAVPPPPDSYAGRVGADRQTPVSGISGDRGRARHDADAGALDESRGQPIGSIVPPESPRQQPPAPQL